MVEWVLSFWEAIVCNHMESVLCVCEENTHYIAHHRKKHGFHLKLTWQQGATNTQRMFFPGVDCDRSIIIMSIDNNECRGVSHLLQSLDENNNYTDAEKYYRVRTIILKKWWNIVLILKSGPGQYGPSQGSMDHKKKKINKKQWYTTNFTTKIACYR